MHRYLARVVCTTRTIRDLTVVSSFLLAVSLLMSCVSNLPLVSGSSLSLLPADLRPVDLRPLELLSAEGC